MPISPILKSRHLPQALLLTLAAACAPQLAAASCGNVTTKMAEILNTRYTADTLVLAHRGLWGKYAGDTSLPENSRGAMNQADVQCMDGVELDIKVTSDGVPVLMHDFNLGRTTNVWQVRGGSKYNPLTNQGTNPAVSTLPWSVVQNLLLLTPDRSVDTGYHVPDLDGLFAYWKQSGMTTPMVFDTKTSGAVRAVQATALKAFPNNPGQIVAVKVNATLYPQPTAFVGDARYITAIPVYTTNMLSKIDVTASRRAWQGYVDTLEINVKQENGLLQGQMSEAHKAGRRIGVFQAIPDGPRAGEFYQNTGACCYKLSELYFSYSGGRDTADHRGDMGYLMSQGFGLITTDDPKSAMRTLKTNGRRVSHYSPR
jgi:hypothetical protein